jgi:hypothetical protein
MSFPLFSWPLLVGGGVRARGFSSERCLLWLAGGATGAGVVQVIGSMPVSVTRDGHVHRDAAPLSRSSDHVAMMRFDLGEHDTIWYVQIIKSCARGRAFVANLESSTG